MMHQKKIISAGEAIHKGSRVLIMLHGRGSNAQDILTLTQHLNVAGFSFLAPEATGNTWYPYSFLAPQKENEPWLSSALSLIKETVEEVKAKGVQSQDIYFLGFSQGACLTLEYTARNTERYGGVVAFTGGLIGDTPDLENYKGDFGSTPIYIGSSDPDPHVPVERVIQTEEILKNMNAEVLLRITKNMGHTIIKEEIDDVNGFVFKNK